MAGVLVHDGELEDRRSPAPVYALGSHRRRPTDAEVTARIGMAVFLGSWAMLFMGLFFAYAFVRARSPEWPPPGVPALPRLLPGLNTLVAAASSAAMVLAVRAGEWGRARVAARALSAAAGLGLAFIVLQSVVWADLWAAGLHPDGGPFPSVFYAFTTFHALHVIVGLVALAALAVRARGGSVRRASVRMWGWYWHFVTLVWAALYATLYLA
jgi:heme/copper-type cytochrome/quinol oxidase subunit 3